MNSGNRKLQEFRARPVARIHVTGHQGAFCQYITAKRKISAANCLRPQIEFWQCLEQADDVSKRPMDRKSSIRETASYRSFVHGPLPGFM
jgi:hypothetical protein